jgi:hypothetical protein
MKYVKFANRSPGMTSYWVSDINMNRIDKSGRLTEDYSQRARNFRVALRRRLEKMKPGQVIRYGKLFWTAQGKNNFRDSLRNKFFPNGRMTPGQDVVQALKQLVKPNILQHRGASGDDMVNAYLKFEGKVNEAAMYKKGQKVQYQIDRGSSNALKPSTGTISKIQKKGNSYVYTVQDGGPVPVHELEIIALTEAFKKGDKVKYLDQPGVITNVEDKGGRTFYSVKYKSPNGTRKAKGVLSTDGSITEANRGKVFKAAKKGSFPATIVVVQNGKVIHQEKVSTPEAAPAKFNVMQEKYPKALIHLEDSTGKRLFSEALKKGDVIKFKNGESIVILGPKGDGYDYQGRGRREKGHHPKGWFDMMIRTGKAVVEDKLTEAHPLNKVIGGYPVKYEGEPRNYRAIITEPMNDRQKSDMIKRAKKAGYRAKPNMGGGVTIFVKEGKLNEMDINDPVLVALRAMKTQMKKKTPVKKIKKVSFDQYLKLIGIQEDLVEDMKDTAEDIQDLFRNMEQEAEPGGGPVADKYGAQLDKLEKKYADLKKKKAVVDKKIENYRMS